MGSFVVTTSEFYAWQNYKGKVATFIKVRLYYWDKIYLYSQ